MAGSYKRNLERNSSDCDAWSGNHDVFSLKEKGSGIWSLKTNAFREEILNPETNFFILTTGKKEHRDKDFEFIPGIQRKITKLDLEIYLFIEFLKRYL